MGLERRPGSRAPASASALAHTEELDGILNASHQCPLIVTASSTFSIRFPSRDWPASSLGCRSSLRAWGDSSSLWGPGGMAATCQRFSHQRATSSRGGSSPGESSPGGAGPHSSLANLSNTRGWASSEPHRGISLLSCRGPGSFRKAWGVGVREGGVRGRLSHLFFAGSRLSPASGPYSRVQGKSRAQLLSE